MFLISAEKYCSLLKKEGGLEVLRELLDDPRPTAKTKIMTGVVIERICDSNYPLGGADRCDNNHDIEDELVDSQDEDENEDDEMGM